MWDPNVLDRLQEPSLSWCQNGPKVTDLTTDTLLVMIQFEELIEKVRRNSPDANIELLRRAYSFSAAEHEGQVRRSGEPYLGHPLEVADFLADMHLDSVAIAAALLHDVVEDTLTTIERIEEGFGPEVAHVVALSLIHI